MSLIDNMTRNAFREALSHYFVRRQIDDMFGAAGISKVTIYHPSVSGQRRALVEEYYASLDFDSNVDVAKLVSVYSEIVSQLSEPSFPASSPESPVPNLTSRMSRLGYEYSNGGFIKVTPHEEPLLENIRYFAAAHDLDGLRACIDRLAKSVEEDPPLAVGTAKELIETIGKTILEDRQKPYDNQDLHALVRSVSQELALVPRDVPNTTKGADTIKRVLGNLSQVSQGLAELRNLYGTGHGRSARTGGIRARHARLAVGAATTLALFLWETHLESFVKPASSDGPVP